MSCKTSTRGSSESCPTSRLEPGSVVPSHSTHLVWTSLEDTGALVDGLRPQADVFVLQLLGCAVHGLGNEAAVRDLTLQREIMAHVEEGQ